MPRRHPRQPVSPQALAAARRNPVLRGLSRQGHVAIADLERKRYWPGAVDFALKWWTLFMRNPYHRIHDRRYEGCDVFECCPDPGDVRAILEVAAHVLPSNDARVLRRRLADLDELW